MKLNRRLKSSRNILSQQTIRLTSGCQSKFCLCVISTCCWLSKRHDMDKADNLNFRVLIFPERKKQKLEEKKKEREKEVVQKLSSSSSEGR